MLQACLYYDEQKNGLSDYFLDNLKSTYHDITENPEAFGFVPPNRKDKFRDVKIDNFPFVVIYEIIGHDVVVLSVFNTYRKPYTIKDLRSLR